MVKILQIHLNYIKNLYNVLLYNMVLIAVNNNIMYDYREINLTKKILKKEK